MNLHVNSCGGYQQQCVDTGKLELPKVRGTNDRQQHSRSLVNWDAALPSGNPHGEWACLNAQSGSSVQGDDLEHIGHTSFSHSQRQPAQRTGASAQAWGTSSASSPRMQLPLDKGLHTETNLWPCSGLDWLATGELSSDQHSGWQNLANGRQWIPISTLCQVSPIP